MYARTNRCDLKRAAMGRKAEKAAALAPWRPAATPA